MTEEIKDVLINHCAPVLMGIKPSAIFTLCCGGCAGYLQKSLSQNVCVEPLYPTSCGRILTMLYNPVLLDNLVLSREAVFMLSALGYPAKLNSESSIKHLKKRFEIFADFPHEIGFFLGYPEEDVLGFIENKGQNYKHCGLWKVYGDVDKYQKRHMSYRFSQECLKKYLECGGDIKNFATALKYAA
jgi:hypothetical protein